MRETCCCNPFHACESLTAQLLIWDDDDDDTNVFTLEKQQKYTDVWKVEVNDIKIKHREFFGFPCIEEIRTQHTTDTHTHKLYMYENFNDVKKMFLVFFYRHKWMLSVFFYVCNNRMYRNNAYLLIFLFF